VVHELHTRVAREFGKAGIDIAYPQRDLHVRSVQGVTLPLPAMTLPATAPVLAVERVAG
jgi:small-conductance mechanosensitive channel